jgi:hypothetical protein
MIRTSRLVPAGSLAMRWHLLTLFAMAGVALAQTTTQQPVAPNNSGMVIQGGYVSTPVMAPTVMTPHITLGVASANPVGATSSAFGLQVGATSAAIPPTNAQMTTVNQAVVSSGSTNPGNVVTGTGPAAAIVAPGPQSNAPANAQNAGGPNASGNVTANEAGGFIPPSAPGPDVAEASRYYRTHPMHAGKVYTNDDINRMNENTANAANAGGSNLPASDMNAPAATSNPASTMPANDQPNATTPQDQRQMQSQPSTTPATPAPKSKPAPYTPPSTPPQR